MEDRLTKLSKVLETGPAILEPSKVQSRTPVAAGAAAGPAKAPRRAPKKPLSEQEKEAAFDQILNTTLRIRER